MTGCISCHSSVSGGYSVCAIGISSHPPHIDYPSFHPVSPHLPFNTISMHIIIVVIIIMTSWNCLSLLLLIQQVFAEVLVFSVLIYSIYISENSINFCFICLFESALWSPPVHYIIDSLVFSLLPHLFTFMSARTLRSLNDEIIER